MLVARKRAFFCSKIKPFLTFLQLLLLSLILLKQDHFSRTTHIPLYSLVIFLSVSERHCSEENTWIIAMVGSQMYLLCFLLKECFICHLLLVFDVSSCMVDHLTAARGNVTYSTGSKKSLVSSVLRLLDSFSVLFAEQCSTDAIKSVRTTATIFTCDWVFVVIDNLV